MVHVKLDGVSVEFPMHGKEARAVTAARSLRRTKLNVQTGGQIVTDAKSRPVVRALHNITLDLHEGDRIGLVGGNGAGKTTLLRVMSGIYEPAAGSVSIRGHIIPFFGGKLGMDMELSGYDNIMLRGTFMGVSRKELAERIDEVAAFTGLEEFLYLPVRTYSAGMKVRLALAIATSIDADILLMDENIGVGDAAFIMKAQTRLQRFVERSGLLVMATHSHRLMKKFCNKAVWLEHGEMRMVGPLDQVYEAYSTALHKGVAQTAEDLADASAEED